jgi:hypothetical protein
MLSNEAEDISGGDLFASYGFRREQAANRDDTVPASVARSLHSLKHPSELSRQEQLAQLPVVARGDVGRDTASHTAQLAKLRGR